MDDPGMDWTRAHLAAFEAKGLKVTRLRSHSRPANVAVDEAGNGTFYYLIVDEPPNDEGYLYVRRDTTGDAFFT